MSTVDSNKEKKVEQTQQPTGVSKPVEKLLNEKMPEQKPAQPKSYTERFVDMERMVTRMAYAINFQANTIKELLGKLEEVGAELERMNMVRKSVNAIMKISEGMAGPFALEHVAQKVEELETQAAKEQLKADLESGEVTTVETIENDLALFEFESTVDQAYGIASMATIDPALKEQLKGKKAGDTVKNLKIVAVYQYNLEKPKALEGNDGQAQATEDQKTAGQ